MLNMDQNASENNVKLDTIHDVVNLCCLPVCVKCSAL